MKKVIIVAAAVLMLASCSQGPKKVTTLTGKFASEAPEEVRIAIPSVLDTIIPVKNSTFSFKLPTSNKTLATLQAGKNWITFIPDGTKLNFDFGEEVKVTSSLPEVSVNTKYKELQDWSKKFIDELDKSQKTILDDNSLTDEVKDSLLALSAQKASKEYFDYNKKVVIDNKDNALAVLALRNIRQNLQTVPLDSLINLLDPSLLENSYVKGLQRKQ